MTTHFHLAWPNGDTAKVSIAADHANDLAAIYIEGSRQRLASLPEQQRTTLLRVELQNLADREGASLEIVTAGNFRDEADVR